MLAFLFPRNKYAVCFSFLLQCGLLLQTLQMVSKAFTVSAKMKTNVVALWFVGALFLNLMGASSSSYHLCENKNCSGTPITYPFGLGKKGCGHPKFQLNCSKNTPFPEMVFMNHTYIIKDILYTLSIAIIQDPIVAQGTELNLCSLGNSTVSFGLQNSDLSPVSGFSVLSFFVNCTTKPPASLRGLYSRLPSCGSKTTSAAMLDTDFSDVHKMKKSCKSVYQVALRKQFPNGWVNASENDIKNQITNNPLKVSWKIDQKWIDKCNLCNVTNGVCGYNTTDKSFLCHCKDGSSHHCHCKDGLSHQSVCRGISSKSKKRMGVIIGGIAGAIAAILMVATYVLMTMMRKKSSDLPPIYRSEVDPTDLDQRNYANLNIFTYEELEVATDFFNTKRELGDGGFGTVYLGKLIDGRRVAVKRLHEHIAKRLEQFVNEVKILSNVHHANLVQLLGYCKERQNLLLVYEYVCNGTLFEHLHSAKSSSMTWETRLDIAIETAQALSYLHFTIKPPILHRDVKSTNILLDENMHVKVADFGLSRLVPVDVTHVSTAPLGTPGYVDPNYHQCYQLTEKSDVYSFGVVLAELISGMKAVDMNRHSEEIGLANLAVTKIQSSCLGEFVDPCIGFHSDEHIMATVRGTAELAFLCLSAEKDDRPCMLDVLAQLHHIKQIGYGCFHCRGAAAADNVLRTPDSGRPSGPSSYDSSV